LQKSGADWLQPYLSGATSISKINTQMLENALSALFPWNLRSQMVVLLPSHFQAPSGTKFAINYARATAPAIEARVQELFGLSKHPTIANGKVPLLIVLLSPTQRPIQTTRDLPGFWHGSWVDVAKDLKGRYPKHYWPEDPVNAPATSRTKPCGTSARLNPL